MAAMDNVEFRADRRGTTPPARLLHPNRHPDRTNHVQTLHTLLGTQHDRVLARSSTLCSKTDRLRSSPALCTSVTKWFAYATASEAVAVRRAPTQTAVEDFIHPHFVQNFTRVPFFLSRHSATTVQDIGLSRQRKCPMLTHRP